MTIEVPAPAKRFPIGLTIATAIALVVLAVLGVWQLQRLAWKEDLLARIAALQAEPARPIGPVLAAMASGADTGFTRVAVDCPGLGAAPFVELYAVRDSGAGVRLISACKVSWWTEASSPTRFPPARRSTPPTRRRCTWSASSARPTGRAS